MVSEKKKDFVQKLTVSVQEYPVVGIVNLQNLPAPQFQKMRKMLMQEGVVLAVSRKRLLERALQESKKPGIEKLKEKLKGMPALLFTKGNPFALYSIIQKNKSEASAKAGQIAPKDIEVKAGATSFAPGPIISELAAVGIKTKVENGKLAIIADVIVAKEGATISGKLAETLKRLDIKPMEIGLDLVAVWEQGVIFSAKDLRVDEEEYAHNFTQSAREAMNLAIEIGYLCSETTEILVQKAFREAKAVGVEAGILTEETRDEILARSEQQALAVKKEANL
ncbi:MAG TPA: 50S ribosomal protein L10 [Candidatus Nanoarchaeia archaeon]|nr:50S ribosomal protein L10 [Candidatus Nanoarchaeia archaeon]